MKKSLLIISFSALVFLGRSQTVISEEYSDALSDREAARPKLIYFIGDMNENRILLKWNVAENESVNLFEVKKSYDGKNFSTSGFIPGSERKGNETYFFPEIIGEQQKIYYCLKIIGNNKKTKYSKVISFQPPFFEKNSLANKINNGANIITSK